MSVFCTPFRPLRPFVTISFFPPRELRDITAWIGDTLSKALRIQITIEAFGSQTTLFKCPNILDNLNLDYNGNLNLVATSRMSFAKSGQTSLLGQEWLGNVSEMTL